MAKRDPYAETAESSAAPIYCDKCGYLIRLPGSYYIDSSGNYHMHCCPGPSPSLTYAQGRGMACVGEDGCAPEREPSDRRYYLAWLVVICFIAAVLVVVIAAVWGWAR